jgi:DNA invertase Pin-like site-specific DNA recombinase
VKRVGLYARVSTKEQTVENQLIDLRTFCKAMGVEVVKEFVDEGISGAKDRRPALDEMMHLVRTRRLKTIVVWKLDRFARSARHLINTLEEFRVLGADFLSYQEGINTSTASGRMFYGMIAIMAEFEREVIRERVLAGIQRAKVEGKHLGRPRIKQSIIDNILAERGKGSIREIASRLKVSRSVVQRCLTQNHIKN